MTPKAEAGMRERDRVETPEWGVFDRRDLLAALDAARAERDEARDTAQRQAAEMVVGFRANEQLRRGRNEALAQVVAWKEAFGEVVDAKAEMVRQRDVATAEVEALKVHAVAEFHCPDCGTVMTTRLSTELRRQRDRAQRDAVAPEAEGDDWPDGCPGIEDRIEAYRAATKANDPEPKPGA